MNGRPLVEPAVPCGRSVAGSTSGTDSLSPDATAVPLDPKPPKRIKDAALLRAYPSFYVVCLSCGSTDRRMHPHHLLLKSQGGDDVLENLVPLCPTCHDRYHRMNDRVVRDALGAYLLSDRGADALEYLRSKRTDGWIEGRFGVTLRVRGRGGEYEDV